MLLVDSISERCIWICVVNPGAQLGDSPLLCAEMLDKLPKDVLLQILAEISTAGASVEVKVGEDCPPRQRRRATSPARDLICLSAVCSATRYIPSFV